CRRTQHERVVPLSAIVTVYSVLAGGSLLDILDPSLLLIGYCRAWPSSLLRRYSAADLTVLASPPGGIRNGYDHVQHREQQDRGEHQFLVGKVDLGDCQRHAWMTHRRRNRQRCAVVGVRSAEQMSRDKSCNHDRRDGEDRSVANQRDDPRPGGDQYRQ